MAVNPFIVPDAAEVVAVGNVVNKTAQENFVMKLFTNNIVPGASTVAGDLTEATFTGYSSKTLTGASWSVASGDPTTATYAAQTFASSADQTAQVVYGYYYVGASSGTIRGIQLLDSPFTFKYNGDSLVITPTFTGQSAN